MTTPPPAPPAPTESVPHLPTGASAEEVQDLLERRALRENLQQGMRRARALDGLDAPPAVGPRDLRGMDMVMSRAYANQAYYFSQPGWTQITVIHRQVSEILRSLNARAERTPQVAIQAARITTLAASLIARHAAQVSSYLDTWGQRDTQGAEAMRQLTRVAEIHAAQAAGLEVGQKLDTPRLMLAHVHKLYKELRAAEPTQPGGANDLGLHDPDDPVLDSTLTLGAASDPDLAEASSLMTALSDLATRAQRVAHRLVIDVRLHGMIDTAQLRGFEMISGIARRAMTRYDNQGRSTEGRRSIAAMVLHYAEQRLERMRGTLGADEQREPGHYESEPPERYMDALFEESRTAAAELRANHITPAERADAQIRFLLAQREIAAVDGDQEWGARPLFPPYVMDLVAGMRTDTPVESRLTLIAALRRRVENNPFHRDAQYLNKVADRFAQEIAGPPQLSPQALEADITADQIRAVAAHVVEQGAVASPLVLSETAELNITHPQAERALAVLHTLNVVGPTNGLKPRQTLTLSSDQLPNQLALLEQRLPNLLELQKRAPGVAATPAPATPAPPATAPVSEALAPAELTLTPDPTPPTAAAEPAPASALPELPRRDRTTERRHPGKLGARKADSPETPADQDLDRLLEGQEDRLKELSQTLIASGEARAAAHPAPVDAAPPKAPSADEAQRNAQQAQQSVGVGVGVGVR